jgi:alpha-mannosidase
MRKRNETELSKKTADGTCYFLGHSHIDAAWLWTFSDTVNVVRDTFETVLKLMDSYPGFFYCQSSAQFYKWMEERYPDTFEKVKKRVKEGRWEIVGGSWIEPDGNLLSGESYVRQYLHGKRYFKERFGIDVQVAWMPDSFGYAWTLPQIMKKSGMKFFLTQKMSWNDTTAFPYHFFKWIAPDGSWLYAHQNVGSYSETVDEGEIVNQMNELKTSQHLSDLLVLFGVGDHGGGVTADMIKRATAFVEGKKKVKSVFTTASEFLNTIANNVSDSDIPELNDEMYLQFHRGTYTTQSRTKKNNRRAESLLETAEKFSTLATKYGYKYPRAELKDCWERLLLNQFHDVLPGSSILDVYRDADETFKSIFTMLDSLISKSLKTIAARIDTSGEGRPLLVFNSLSWKRTSVAEFPLKDTGDISEIYDEKGQIIPSQIIDEERKLIFVAEDVPSLGYKEFKAKRTGHVRKKFTTDLSSKETEREVTLENKFLRLNVDKESGLVTSIFDKRENREALRGEANLIQIFDDTPVKGRTSVKYPIDASIFDAWEIFIYQQEGGTKCTELNHPLLVRLVESGPVRARIQVKHKYTQEDRTDSTFVQEIILHDKIPLVQFKIYADWHAAHRLAKVAFPLSVHSDSTSYEAPYGHITRLDPTSQKAGPAEKAKYEVPGQKWIDHSSEDKSFGVSLLNDCKYGFDASMDVIRMTLLRSPSYPFGLRRIFGLPVDESSLSLVTDQGEHVIAYSLYPHRSDFGDALTARKAYEFNYPLTTFTEPTHTGSLPKGHSFLSIDPDNMIVTVLKKAEDSDSRVLRFYETSGKDSEATIHTALTFGEAFEADLMENQGYKVTKEGSQLSLRVTKNEIKTIKIIGE